jgi:predicted DNA-binding transcriptional regulator YafY
VRRLLETVERGESLTIVYYAGDLPGTSRTVHPRRIFTVSGYDGTYLSAYCETRCEERVFRLDRVEIPGIGCGSAARRTRAQDQAPSPTGSGCVVSVAVLILQVALITGALGALLRWL